MSSKFVRNITGTKLTGDVQEPLDTNMQNDLLSDDEDVFVRNKDEYHCLTDNIKDVTSKNDVIEVNKTGKNSVELVGKETKIVSKNDKLIIKKNDTNDYELEVTVQGGEGGGSGLDYDVISDNSHVLNINYETTENKKTFRLIPNMDVLAVKGDVYGVESKTPETLKVNKNTTDKVYELTADLSGYATKEDLEEISPTPNVPVKIDSKTPTILKVDKNGENDFSLTADLKDYATKEEIEVISNGVQNVVSADTDVLKAEKKGTVITLTPDLSEFAKKIDLIFSTNRYKILANRSRVVLRQIQDKDVYLIKHTENITLEIDVELKPLDTEELFMEFTIFVLGGYKSGIEGSRFFFTSPFHTVTDYTEMATKRKTKDVDIKRGFLTEYRLTVNSAALSDYVTHKGALFIRKVTEFDLNGPEEEPVNIPEVGE